MRPPDDGSPPGDDRVDDAGDDAPERDVPPSDDAPGDPEASGDDGPEDAERSPHDAPGDPGASSDDTPESPERSPDEPAEDVVPSPDDPPTDVGDASSGTGEVAEAGAGSDGGPPPKRADGSSSDGPQEMTVGEFLAWLRTTDHGVVAALREMLSTAAVVLLVGALLFGVSGVWPPMVAVESGSMTPHMEVGDLVFVMDEQRLKPAAAEGTTGVVSYRTGRSVGYRSFGSYGDVIVYRPDGSTSQTPIIHRARFWVEEGENWYRTKADPDHVNPNYQSCEQLPSCPAPHAGFVTKGDNNQYYDQAIGMSGPVRPTWITGTAEFRIPWLGCIRLGFPPGCLAPPQRIPPSWFVVGALAVVLVLASFVDW